MISFVMLILKSIKLLSYWNTEFEGDLNLYFLVMVIHLDQE